MSLTNDNFPYGETIQWFSPDKIEQLPPTTLKNWLLAQGSLTQKLQNRCTHFEVKVLGEGYNLSFSGEYPIDTPIWVREVLLYLDGIPWIFARSLIPNTLLQQTDTNFLNLGVRPLGELLFSSGQFTPGEIKLAYFTPGHKLATLIASLKQDSQQLLWSRKRSFHAGQEQLIVSETFLPYAQQQIALQQF